jgi:ATP-dependent exoDNAse (exonuclease V) beta subunit
MDHIQVISAGAGSGKTFTITSKLEELLKTKQIRPSNVIATTFTKLAASELQERVRQKLIESGQTDTANAVGESLIGTVNGVCGELIQRFSFEAGLSPELKVMEEGDSDKLFAQALEIALIQHNDMSLINQMNQLSLRLGLVDDGHPAWQKEVMEIVASARSNNMQPDEVRSFAKSSFISLKRWLPTTTERDLTASLRKAVDSALKQYDPAFDTTKGSKEYFEFLSRIQLAINYERITWPEWISLSKNGPAKKSNSLAEPIQLIAADYCKHPQFQKDLEDFITHLFAIAAESMSHFQALKRKMGLIDFVDQEHTLLQILDHPEVQEALKDEIDLLMVDEFQDTSPIQLAVFIKLASLAKQVIWVGDIKQSIYGFRGADPELMISVVGYLASQGNMPQILSDSYRSRPPLVHYVNNIFSQTFCESLNKEQIVLNPKREDSSKRKDDSAVEFWHVDGSSLAKRAPAIGEQVKQLITRDGIEIFDKEKKIYRPAQYGDVAILCRTNTNLSTIATGFAELGIPCEYKRSGLLATPEGCLAMACLRRLVDDSDTLASAEIITLSESSSPETWLADRIEWLQSGEKSKTWAEETHPILNALKEQRKRLSILSPKEVMTLALDASYARRNALKWCRSEYEALQRLGNIDLFIQYAEAYEQNCEVNNSAASAPGLILYLTKLAENKEDLQALPGGNAVTLVTHHRSKGLEWPIVIAMDLDSKIKSRLWGLSVLENENGFDWHAPLAGRQLKYWPAFFGQQSAGIELKDKIVSSEFGEIAQKKAIEEIKRLLYVSLTRPRDKLIITLHGKKPGGEWLNALGADWMLPKDKTLTLPDGQAIPTRFVEVKFSGEASTGTQEKLYWLDTNPRFHHQKLPKTASPSSALAIEGAVINRSVDLGERIHFSGAPDMAQLGSCLHAVIATEIIHRDQSISRVNRILEDFGMADTLTAKDALDSANRFIEKVESIYSPINWHVEYPIHYFNDKGQESNGYIDLALETEQGWVIIDHKSSPKARSEWESVCLSYSGQLALYKEALEATGKTVAGCWIHFAITGGLLSLSI